MMYRCMCFRIKVSFNKLSLVLGLGEMAAKEDITFSTDQIIFLKNIVQDVYFVAVSNEMHE